MSKKQINITKSVMSKIKKDNIKMKPKWYFWLGSAALFTAISSLTIILVFLVSLITFSLRNRGGWMATIRYQQMIDNFPWWATVVLVVGLITGTLLLKKYDFSYKKNFLFIVSLFILSIIAAGVLIDLTGFNNIFIKRGPMKRFYQQYHQPFYRYRNLR